MAGGRPSDNLDAWVLATAPRAVAYARSLLRNPDEAEDVVQEAFISAFRSIESFQGGARLSTWLHRIVVNAALMRLRSKRRLCCARSTRSKSSSRRRRAASST